MRGQPSAVWIWKCNDQGLFFLLAPAVQPLSLEWSHFVWTVAANCPQRSLAARDCPPPTSVCFLPLSAAATSSTGSDLRRESSQQLPSGGMSLLPLTLAEQQKQVFVFFNPLSKQCLVSSQQHFQWGFSASWGSSTSCLLPFFLL